MGLKLNNITIRMTNFCNEECEHCVFSSGPSFNKHLTIELSEKLQKWIPPTTCVTILGGEFTLVPDYDIVASNIVNGKAECGFITNGIFVESEIRTKRFIDFINSLGNKRITVRVSQSQYHSPKLYGLKAYGALQELLVDKKNLKLELIQKSIILPIGRAYDNGIEIEEWANHPEYGAFCENENHLFIDEEGYLHYCPTGNSKFDHIDECAFDLASKEIFQWRKEKIAKGMNCLGCSENGVGNCQKKKLDFRIKSILTCRKSW